MENNINVKSKFLQIFFCDKIIDELLRFLLNWRQLGQKQHLATVNISNEWKNCEKEHWFQIEQSNPLVPLKFRLNSQ